MMTNTAKMFAGVLAAAACIGWAGQARASDAEGAALKYRAVLEGGRYVCRDADGQGGLNKVSVEDVKRSKAGECAKLSHEDLAGLAILRTNLEEGNFKGANLYGAVLLRVDFEKADLSGADLSRADLRGADFKGAKMHLTDLSNTWMAGADLRKADLRGAYLSMARMWEAKFNEADLRGAIVGEPSELYLLDGADLSGAIYDAKTKLPFDEAEAGKRGMVKAE